VEEGYALLPRAQTLNEKNYRLPKPIITQIVVNENGAGQRNLRGVGDSLIFRSTERNLRFFFTQPLYTSNVLLRSKLIGFDNQWTAFSKNFNREFTNLNTGSYQFQIQAENSPEMATLSFVIEPRWYQTLWARLGAVLLGVFVLWLFYRLHNARLQRHLAKLEAEKAKELNRQQTESENRMLQAEVLNKSRKLADTTINLVRKNETLMKINEELIGAKKEKDMAKLSKKLQQLNRLVEGHIANEEDWQIFEETFNQLHDQFFKRLKEKFPELTPGDFRLAAYLKMNLSSKEIAPLLNISLRGVENKRYRLRRKLGLPAEDNLVEFFMQF
jgi:DNA-binding CsgD family transcriptional regulator